MEREIWHNMSNICINGSFDEKFHQQKFIPRGILTCEQNTAEGYSLKHCLQQFKTTNNIIAYQQKHG